MITKIGSSKLETEKYTELLLPRKENVVISNSTLLKRTVHLEDSFIPHFYRLTFSTQIKALSFLGEYASTLVRTGLYDEDDLDSFGWRIHSAAPHYLKLKTGFN